MGLNLASIGKKIEGLGAQINPFDHGATYSTVVNNQHPAAPPPVAPVVAPRPQLGFNAINGGAPNPAFINQPPPAPISANQNDLSAKLSHLVGGIISPATNTAGLLANDISLVAARATNNKVALKNASAAGAQKAQALIDTARAFTTRPAVALATSVIPRQVQINPNNPIEKALLGTTPVQNIEKGVATNYNQHPNLNPLERVGLAGAYGAGQLATDVPVVGAEAKLLSKGAKAGTEVAKVAQAIPRTEAGAVGKNIMMPDSTKTIKNPELKDYYSAKIAELKSMDGHNITNNKETGVRSSDNSPLYSELYAKNGRPPTNQDYVDYIHQENVAGRGVGVTSSDEIDAYNRLIKQPNKPSPALPKVTAKQPPQGVKPVVQAAGQGTLPTNDLQSLLQSAPPPKTTVADKVMANTTGVSPEQAALARGASQVKLEAEQAALNHLKGGGTRDEAVKIYQDATGRTLKQSRYRVQQIAKQANQSLNVSPATTNPLLNDFKLPEPKAGEFKQAPTNRRAVVNSIDLAEKRVTSAVNKLQPTDRANLVDYIQGTQDIKAAKDPTLTQQAVDEIKRGTDTTHALGQNYGNTKHIDQFFPGYYERTAEQLAADKLQAEQNLEEQVGTQTWNKMSETERNQALADYNPNIPHGEDVNYGGLHSKGKIYKNQQEALAAGETLAHNDPLDALHRYFTGAKLQLGDQAMIQGVRHAEPIANGQRYSIDLPGGGNVRVGKEGIKVLKNEGIKKPASVGKKVLQGANTTTIKTIVANPLFHGTNQEFNGLFQTAWRIPGNRVQNMVNLVKNQATLKGADLDTVKTEYYAKGGFSPTYGKDNYGFIAKGLQKVGIDPKNAEFSPRGMAALEENIRLGLYKTARDRGMNPTDAIKTINQTLGSPEVLGDMASSVGLFLHYLTMNTKLLGDVGVQATKGNLLPLTGLAVGYASWMAANKAWQDVTGNKDASVRAPGVLGTAMQLSKAPVQLKRGQVPSVVVSHTNPLVTTGIEQIANRDLRKPVVGPQSRTNTLSGPGGSGRLKVASSNLVGPGLTVQGVAGQKTSLPEAAVGFATGLYTPHAKGYQAAPNIPALNTPGAKTGTGLDAQKQYFAASDKANALVYGDARAQSAFDNYVSRDKNSQGKTVLLSPEQAISAAAGLAGNDKALQAVQTLKRDGNSSHDPMWDLSTKDLKTFLNYQATRKTDPEKAVKLDQGSSFNNGQGLSNFISQRSSWYSKGSNFGGAGTVNAPDTPTYPSFPTSTQSNLTSYGNITDATAKGQFLDAHPDIVQAFNSIAKYNNALGVAQGGNALKNYPEASAKLQSFMADYTAASKAQRTAIRNSNPQQYQNMIGYFDSVDLYGIGKQAAKSQYQGEPDYTSSEAKQIASLAKDVYQNPDQSYSIVPAGWMQGLSNSSGSSGFSSSSKPYKPRTPRSYRKKVSFKKGKGSIGKAKIAKPEDDKTKKGGRAKVSLKPSLV